MGNYASIRERDSKGRFIVPSIKSNFDLKKYKKEYRIKHSKELSLKAAEWNRKNKERRKLIKDRWRAKNRERTNFLARRHIYLRKNAIGTHSPEELQELKSKLFGLCAYCLKAKSDTIDHVIPLSRGGTNFISNLLPACVSCNSKKRDRLFSEWKPIIYV